MSREIDGENLLLFIGGVAFILFCLGGCLMDEYYRHKKELARIERGEKP